jgi:predicted DNA-binding protein (MmcQ/YjbR family)
MNKPAEENLRELSRRSRKGSMGECTFRVAGGKMFAMTDNNHHESGHLAVWVMAPPSMQENLIRSMPGRFFKPPYVGPKGWVGVRLDASLDWDHLAAILRDGYLISAPAKLARSKSPRSEATGGDQSLGSKGSARKSQQSRTATGRTR